MTITFACDIKPNREEVYENMTPPIIVVAKSERVYPKVVKGYTAPGTKGTIILQDSKGVSVSFMDTDKYGNALHSSYEKGDTILTIVK